LLKLKKGISEKCPSSDPSVIELEKHREVSKASTSKNKANFLEKICENSVTNLRKRSQTYHDIEKKRICENRLLSREMF